MIAMMFKSTRIGESTRRFLLVAIAPPRLGNIMLFALISCLSVALDLIANREDVVMFFSFPGRFMSPTFK